MMKKKQSENREKKTNTLVDVKDPHILLRVILVARVKLFRHPKLNHPVTVTRRVMLLLVERNIRVLFNRSDTSGSSSGNLSWLRIRPQLRIRRR